jgi:Family of unknown function (DUF6335)
MAKRKTSGRKATRKMAKKTQRAVRSAKRPSKFKRRSKPKAAAKARKATPKKKATKRRASKSRKAEPSALRSSPARLSRQRRTLDDLVVPTPPSSLDMNRRSSAVRSGRAEMAEEHAKVASLTPDINAGDVDVNVEDAYFVGDEAPGGDNPTPDQDVVDDIGKALGVEYQDAEELRSGDKVADRDKHRWELDPASSEDYKNRK